MCADVQMGELKGPGDGEDQRDVFWFVGFCVGGRGYDWRWTGGNTTRERGFVVDVEFEEVEERICDEWNGAIEF